MRLTGAVVAALLGLVAATALLVISGLWYLSGGRVLGVATGSMEPLIHPGDAVLVYKIDSASVQVGNVISYRSSNNVVVPITHRVTAVQPNGTFTTQGDALTQPDPPVHSTQVIGQVQAVAPHLGIVLQWLRKPYVMAAVIYMPVALIALAQLRRVQEIWHLPTYSFRHKQRV